VVYSYVQEPPYFTGNFPKIMNNTPAEFAWLNYMYQEDRNYPAPPIFTNSQFRRYNKKRTRFYSYNNSY
jgi:hypothetical protein